MNDIYKTIATAADHIEDHPELWVQGNYETITGRCMIGHLNYIGGGKTIPSDLKGVELESKTLQTLGFEGIVDAISFNDEEGRTPQEVVKRLRSALTAHLIREAVMDAEVR